MTLCEKTRCGAMGSDMSLSAELTCCGNAGLSRRVAVGFVHLVLPERSEGRTRYETDLHASKRFFILLITRNNSLTYFCTYSGVQAEDSMPLAYLPE